MPLVYMFDHPHETQPKDLGNLLGGKGANLAEMTSVLGLPVPPGFTITTDACRAYLAAGWPAGLDDEVGAHLAQIEAAMGRRLGEPADPLLVSVRSGAKYSMPGMIHTVLNLGLNDTSVEGLAKQTSDERFAYDAYPSLHCAVRAHRPRRRRCPLRPSVRRREGPRRRDPDAEVPPELLRYVVRRSQQIVADVTGQPLPQDPRRQFRAAHRGGVRVRGMAPERLRTALGSTSPTTSAPPERAGHGVRQPRRELRDRGGLHPRPRTGAQGSYGDFLMNAQGEDVVAGVRANPPALGPRRHFPGCTRSCTTSSPGSSATTATCSTRSSRSSRASSRMLQTRVGQRTGLAALRTAVEMTTDPDIRLTPRRGGDAGEARAGPRDCCTHSSTPRTVSSPRKGPPASPGGGRRARYFDADDVVAAVERGEPAILVRIETSPDDVHGLQVARGSVDGPRGAGQPRRRSRPGLGHPGRSRGPGPRHRAPPRRRRRQHGARGRVDLDRRHVGRRDARPAPRHHGRTTARVCDRAGLGRRHPARPPRGARQRRQRAERRAPGYSAEGIGLCRTEHMFLGERLPAVQRMILADNPEGGAKPSPSSSSCNGATSRRSSPRMDGLPVTVRLLDPPLHEFLPDIEDLIAREARGDSTRCHASCSPRPAPGTSRTRCWAPGACASGSSRPACTRCRYAGPSRLRPGGSSWAAGPGSRS